MEEAKNKAKPKSHKNEAKTPVTYNEIRAGIVDEVNKHFSTSNIVAYEKNQLDSVTQFVNEFEQDTAVPEDLDLLYNYNAGINLIESKWIRRYNSYNKGLTTNLKKLEVLEARITQEYKRNPEVHNGVLLNDKEIRNLIVLYPEHIELEEKIINIKAILSVIEKAISRIDSISYRITNAVNILKIKNNMQW